MNNSWKKFIPLIIVLVMIFIGLGYYIVANQIGMATRDEANGEPAGFWLGLWQGAITCLAFIASWFDNNVVLYQAHNSGFWYNFGFVIGLTIFSGGSAGDSHAKKTKKTKRIALKCNE